MNPRTLLLGVAALAAAGVTALLVQGWLDRQRATLAQQRPSAPAVVKPSGHSVLVAKAALSTGHLIRPGDLAWQAWPAGGLAPSYLVKGQHDMGSYVGAVVRRGIGAHTPITADAIVKPGDHGFLAAVLTPGHRAIAVPVNAASVIAGLVFPGDRVDLILTHKFEVKHAGTNSGDRDLRQASETVVTNIRVLALDQTTDDQKGKSGVPKTATIEVTPKQAEMVSLALSMGKLSLSLRSLAKELAEKDGTPVRDDRTLTRDSEVSRVLAAGRHGTKKLMVNVLRGSKAEARAVDEADK